MGSCISSLLRMRFYDCKSSSSAASNYPGAPLERCSACGYQADAWQRIERIPNPAPRDGGRSPGCPCGCFLSSLAEVKALQLGGTGGGGRSLLQTCIDQAQESHVPRDPRVGDPRGRHRKAVYSGFHVFAFIGVSPPLEAEAKGLHTFRHLLKRDLCVT